MIRRKVYATLLAQKLPDEKQKQEILAFLKKKHGIEDMVCKYDETITDGFKIIFDNKVYDWTKEGFLRRFRNTLESAADSREIIPIFKQAMDDFGSFSAPEEIGTVKTVGDGIAIIEGLESAEYGEILAFENGVKGQVLDLREKEIGCMLFDDSEKVFQGDTVIRTGKVAGIPVGEKFIGRVIDALGNPIDGKGDIEADDYRPVESPAPSIVDRQPVNVPLETGILTIDSMFPIGRGQRELIIGDRQIGKTTIAIDTIINQKGKNVICIYVAIGQKASSVANTVDTLETFGAMDYTVVISSTAGDPASLQYIAPYAGCSLGEYFMYKGRDVLIVYDDLSKHSVAYRSISLLLGRFPGREAFPGDIFYLHSRLLERAAHLSEECGGGSMTALPIVETQAGDVSAYIPTNVISITDGQIFLETDLFFSGQRPAVNIGLSVSRVGGDAQSPAVKKACGSFRLELAQYREMAAFMQFSGDIDDEAKSRLDYGRKLMLTLRQNRHSPLSAHRQVVILTVILNGKLKNVEDNNIHAFLDSVCENTEGNRDICYEIDNNLALSEKSKAAILEIADNTEL